MCIRNQATREQERERGRVVVSHESLQNFALIFNTRLGDFEKGGRGQTFVISSPKPFLSNSIPIHG